MTSECWVLSDDFSGPGLQIWGCEMWDLQTIIREIVTTEARASPPRGQLIMPNEWPGPGDQ